MRHIAPITTVLLGLCLFIIASYLSGSFKADEVGLGRNTTSHIGRFEGKKLSAISDNLDSVIWYIKNETKINESAKTAVWFGNSQLHSINYYQPGNKLAVEYVNLKLKNSGSNITPFQFSSPHLNFIEELLYLSELASNNINPQVLIIPITYRSFHFSTIRAELKNLSGYKQIEKIIINPDLQKIYSYEKESDERGKLSSKEKTWQDKSEEAINACLTTIFPIYAFRENTKSFISFFPLQAIHFFSDKTKDLNVKGKDETVLLNKSALAELLNYSKQKNIKVLLYQVPHPQDPAFFFYNKEAYHTFFNDIRQLSSKYSNVTFLNLSESIPLDLWGTSNDGYKDTYHFKDKGHQILGDTIATTIKTMLN